MHDSDNTKYNCYLMKKRPVDPFTIPENVWIGFGKNPFTVSGPKECSIQRSPYQIRGLVISTIISIGAITGSFHIPFISDLIEP